MADQFANGQEADRLGFGVHIPFLDLTEKKLSEGLKKVIEEPTHAQNARNLGSALIDQVKLLVYLSVPENGRI
jgi:UDP:flavonoid glycosyltransferase YjiC (YdhE family)